MRIINAVLRVAICEDDGADLASILEAIDNSGYPTETASFSSGSKMLETYQEGQYHIIFLDIYMPGMNGVDTAQAIRAVDDQVVIVFVTTSMDHTREGYRFGVLKYIEKPFHPRDVKAALELAWRINKSREMCTISTKHGKQEAVFGDILYVEASNHMCNLHFANKRVQTNISIDGMALLLPPPYFVRCHRSFIVNLAHVKAVDRDFVMINDDRVYIRGKDVRKMTDLFARYLADESRRVGREGCSDSGPWDILE